LEWSKGGTFRGSTERLAAWPRAARARYAVAFPWSQRAHIASPSDLPVQQPTKVVAGAG